MRHAYVFLAALALTAPLVAPLCRAFFGSWPHFAYDAGLRPVPERLQWRQVKSQLGTHLVSVLAALLLDLLGVFVAYAVVLGSAYYTLLWVLSFFQPGP